MDEDRRNSQLDIYQSCDLVRNATNLYLSDFWKRSKLNQDFCYMVKMIGANANFLLGTNDISKFSALLKRLIYF